MLRKKQQTLDSPPTELLPISWSEKSASNKWGVFFLRARSSLSELQRGQLVALFEPGLGYTAAAHRLGVARGPVRMLERRFKLHGKLCLVENQPSSSIPSR